MEYKFGPSVLLEIVNIVQKGLTEGEDVSQLLRDLEVEVDQDGTLKLSEKYVKVTRN